MPAGFSNRQNAGWTRFRIGGWEATILWDGYIHHGYAGIYPNADPKEMERLQRLHRLPSDHIPMDCNPVVVNTGERLVLVDAGMGRASTMFGDKQGRLMETLQAAGFEPGQVDAVLMTHLHPDHSFGLINPDGSAAFPKADLWIAKADWDEWTDEAKLQRNDWKRDWTEGTRAAVAPYEGRIHLFEPGATILPGVSTLSVAGHAAGMTAYVFENGGQKVIFTGDLAHHQVYDPWHPEWFFHMEYDTDPAQGAEAKARVFRKVVDEGIRFHGYHFPWPGLGTFEAVPDGTYRFHADLPTPRLA